MDTTALDTLTDQFAKTNSTMFPITEKLSYYNIGYGLLYGLIIDEKEDNYEQEDTSDTVADQNDYGAPSRIHHINWLKVDYGQGFVPARYMSEQEQIQRYGNQLETALSQWDKSNPIYWFTGDHFFIAPTPTTDQAAAGRLKASFELLPDDLEAGETPDLPENFQHLLAVYSAYMYHDINGEDGQAQKRKGQFDEGAKLMIETMFPRARQQEIVARPPEDDGSQY